MLFTFSMKIWEVMKKNPKAYQVVKKFSCKLNITEICSESPYQTLICTYISVMLALTKWKSSVTLVNNWCKYCDTPLEVMRYTES